MTAYSTSPCSVPGIGSSKCSWYVRVWVMPAFSAARRDRVLTAIVVAQTRRTANSLKARSISARDPSVA